MQEEHQINMNSIPESFVALQQAFQPQNAQGVENTMQFDFTGPEAGTWHASIKDGQFTYGQGPAQNPNATVTVNSDDWLKVLRGEESAQAAAMAGKIKLDGDASVMMRYQSWFARPS
jgi:putative sterol carrier protein